MAYTLDIFDDKGRLERTIEATDEQAAIIDYVIAHPDDNLIIESLPGGAKTSTLQFLCKYRSAIPTLSIAFNKRIADRMAQVLPANVRSGTANSVCHRVWGSAIGRRLTVDTKKNYNLVREFVDALPKRQRSEAWDVFSDLTKALSRAKLLGYVPPGSPGRSLVTPSEFFATLDEAPDEWFMTTVNNLLGASIKQSYAGLIDFDDQIYMSVLFGGSFPSFPRVKVDEFQDFSPLNLAMLDRLVGPNTQLTAVGDPNQSIYAFRGADTQAMARGRERFNMHQMNLSVSFRCAINICKNAHFRAPHMQWPTWATEGTVEELGSWNAECIPDGAAIVCRNNAPLMSAALRLLSAGRGVQLIGTDLGPQLVKTLKRLSSDLQTPQDRVFGLITEWEDERLKKARDASVVADKAECLRVFAGFGPTLGAAIAYCEHIFQSKGPIQLLSGHKSKGLEWRTVYHLDPHRIPSPWSKEGDAYEQELNVKFVVETRPKEELYFVRLEDFNGDA